MTSFTITVDDKAVQAELKALADRVKNMRPVLQNIGEGIVERTKRRFETSTGPDGVKWKDNSPATRKAKGGKPPLINHGTLRRQIFPTVRGNTLTVEASPVYAAIHQFGGSIDVPAKSMAVRHRTDAKGELLRSALMNGRGLIFAKDRHKRAVTRWFEVGAHTINIPARPFLPIHQDGTLYPAEQSEILQAINSYLMDSR